MDQLTTPRSDAAALACRPDHNQPIDYVPYTFARRLEYETTTLHHTITYYASQRDILQNANNELHELHTSLSRRYYRALAVEIFLAFVLCIAAMHLFC